MSENKHTPGPWTVVTHGEAAYVSMFVGKDGLPPSATGNAEFSVQPYIRRTEALANARLIAAAPNLLSTLLQAEAFISGFEGDGTQDGVEALLAGIRSAIAKAEGQP